jgi:hypothetical protein
MKIAELRQDFRYALRQLARSPAFALIARNGCGQAIATFGRCAIASSTSAVG